MHTGVAYVGAVGSEESFTDFTALGDPVITASRLASAAQAGEILVSQHAQVQAKLDVSDHEWRTLTLKGKTEVDIIVARYKFFNVSGSTSDTYQIEAQLDEEGVTVARGNMSVGFS